MEVGITTEAVIEGVSKLSPIRSSIDCGALPHVSGLADRAAECSASEFAEWWKRMTTGASEDVAALHRLIVNAADASVKRDRDDAVQLAKVGDVNPAPIVF